jgi:2-phospho-L-lactate guanylyltransferase
MSAAAIWAIVPVKALARAKRRLSPTLPPPARQRLVLAMLEDVLAQLAASGAVDRILVVSPDARVAALAAAKGALVLSEDRPRGLNHAVKSGLAHARAQGAERALVLPADVPFATSGEIASVVDAAAGGRRVALVPAADGDGTNAMLLAPLDAIEPSFGPGSFARHLARAVARRFDTQVLPLPGLGRDIDEPDDLARLLSSQQLSGRYHFLSRPPTGRLLAGPRAQRTQP